MFDQTPELGLSYVVQSTDIRCQEINCFKKIRIIDVAGCQQNRISDDQDQDQWSEPVEKGGLGIGRNNANIAAIYVINSQVIFVVFLLWAVTDAGLPAPLLWSKMLNICL